MIADVALTGAAIAIAYVIISDRGRTADVGEAPSGKPTYQKDWETAHQAGIEVGDANGELRLVEFVDLECPACAYFHLEVLPGIRQKLPGLSHRIVHFPLPSHRQAVPAAHAAECARLQGRFPQFVDTTLSAQRELGVVSWGNLARRAGVRDSASFARCMEAPTPRSIERSGFAFSDSETACAM
ncbi:MAG: DsbA family protein [Gemmatimonadaceae bacterium]|nr:DsbA family protein [Gemmatimonadaceae bacterium]